MPSIREQLLQNLTAHMSDRLDGWSVQRHSGLNKSGDLPRLVIYYIGHRKRLRAHGAGSVEYTTEVEVMLEVKVAFEAADAEIDGGNPLRYVARLSDLVETELHRVLAYEPPESQMRLDVDATDFVSEEGDQTTASAVITARFAFNETFEVTV